MRVMLMAGGTGGHIYPGLAVAEALRAKGAEVRWLGTRHGLEAELVPAAGLPIDWIRISGVRGKGWLARLFMPLNLLRAVWQGLRILRRFKPDVTLGLGGYVAAPGGLASALLGIPLLIHEQNARAGSTNRLLARVARQVFSAYPDAFGVSTPVAVVGNPVRREILQLPSPAERGLGQQRPLRLLVLGGSQGALILNRTVPAALGMMAEVERPTVRHQAGRTLGEAQRAYTEAGLQISPEAFINDMAAAYAQADLVICRAGALSLAEIMAAGLPAICVPLPHAIDDHQTANARFLVDAGAAWLLPEAELSPQSLAAMLAEIAADPAQLLQRAEVARSLAAKQATEELTQACLHWGHA